MILQVFFLILMRFVCLEPTAVTTVTQMAGLIVELGMLTSKWLFEPSSWEQYSVKGFKRFSILIRSPELLWANSRLSSDNVAHSGKQTQDRTGRRERKHRHCFSVNRHAFVVQCFATGPTVTGHLVVIRCKDNNDNRTEAFQMSSTLQVTVEFTVA